MTSKLDRAQPQDCRQCGRSFAGNSRPRPCGECDEVIHSSCGTKKSVKNVKSGQPENSFRCKSCEIKTAGSVSQTPESFSDMSSVGPTAAVKVNKNPAAENQEELSEVDDHVIIRAKRYLANFSPQRSQASDSESWIDKLTYCDVCMSVYRKSAGQALCLNCYRHANLEKAVKSDILKLCVRGESGETRIQDLENKLCRLEAGAMSSGGDSSIPAGKSKPADLSAVTKRLSEMTKEMEILERENEELRRSLIPAGANGEHRSRPSQHPNVEKSTMGADLDIVQRDREASKTPKVAARTRNARRSSWALRKVRAP